MSNSESRSQVLLVFGAGGHGRVIADVFSRAQPGGIVNFLDDKLFGQTINGHPVIGRLSDWQKAVYELSQRFDNPIGLIIGIGDNTLRRQWALQLQQAINDMDGRARFSVIADPSAVVSTTASLGPGTLLVPQSVVNANAMIGSHVILNTTCSVDHDCKLGDYVHIAPGARLAGGVQVGDGTHIGVGASVIPGIRIGAWSIIGAGSVVVEDVPNGVVAFGVPARVRRVLPSEVENR